jgi:transketolase N-terminal domain/subunit
MSADAAISASARAIRRAILTQSRRANRGHIGSALSVADLVAGIVNTLNISGRHVGESGRTSRYPTRALPATSA